MARRMVWLDSNFAANVGDGNVVTASLMATVSDTERRMGQWTLARTIIGIDLAYAVHDAGEGSQILFMGMGIINDESFAVPSSVPNPSDTTEFPQRGWVYRASYRIFGFAADQPAVFVRRVEKDLRSQRKLDNGLSFVNFAQVADEGVAATVKVTGIIRQLWGVS